MKYLPLLLIAVSVIACKRPYRVVTEVKVFKDENVFNNDGITYDVFGSVWIYKGAVPVESVFNDYWKVKEDDKHSTLRTIDSIVNINKIKADSMVYSANKIYLK